MNDAYRRRMDKFNRERVFFDDNGADFPAGSPAETVSAQIDANVAEILQRDAELSATLGDKERAQAIKMNRRDLLLEAEREIVSGAAAIGDAAVEGITAKFKMPHPRTDQNIIADADAKFADTAPPLEAQFVTVGLDATFRADLQAAKTAFQQARDDADSALEEHAGAVGALADLFRRTMALSRQRSAIVKLKYRDNPRALAAWTVASHLERAPKSDAGDAPVTPTPQP